MRRFIRLAQMAVLVATATLPLAARADDLQIRVQALLDGFRAEYRFPGATMAYVLPDGTTGTVATGLSDVEGTIAMTPQSRMLAASIGKSFVAATVLALEREGLLDTGNLISQHLGGRAWFDRLPNHATITVSDLLRHTSGLSDHVHMEAFAAALAERMQRGEDAISPEDAIGFVLDQEPLFDAGQGWAYSDTGYLLLGLIIEAVAGCSYYDLVEERFLVPLGLTQTTPSNMRVLPNLAVGYTGEGNPFGMPPRTMDLEGRLLWDPAMEWTGGGFVSTSRDLAVWGAALFGGKAMAAPYLAQLLDAVRVAPDTPGVLYGSGVAIYAETPRGPVFGHGGWIPGYVSSLRHYSDMQVTIAFQINTDVGIMDDRSDLVPALEAALADLIIAEDGKRVPQARIPAVRDAARVCDSGFCN